ncbi:MAG: hypothetical protein ACREHD_07065 [Pirellulales bacterium]
MGSADFPVWESVQPQFATLASQPQSSASLRLKEAVVRCFRPLVVLGTRPEIIKLAPVVSVCRRSEEIAARVCFTGQHRELVLPLADYFGVRSDYELAVMSAGQSLAELTSRPGRV